MKTGTLLKLWLLIIFLGLAAGCGRQKSAPPQVAEVEPSATIEAQPTAVPSPTLTATPVPPTATPQPTATATKPPTATAVPTTTFTPTPDVEAQYEGKMEEGAGYAAEAQWEEALEAFQEALLLNPQSGQAHHNIGHVLQMVGDLEKAIEHFNQAIELDPENVEFYLSRGFTLSGLGQSDEALADYAKGIELAPEDPRFFYNRAIEYKMQEQYDLALADYDRAIELDPQFAYAYHNRANIYWDLGQLDLALADFDKGLELDPEDSLGYLNRAQLHEELDQPEQALADYDQAQSLLGPDFMTFGSNETVNTIWLEDGQNEGGWIFALVKHGILNHQLGNDDQSFNDVNLAASANPEIALDTISDNIDLNTQDSFLFFAHGLACEKLWQNELAMQDYNEAINHGLNDPLLDHYYLHRGRIHTRMEAYEDAIADWQQTIAIDPENRDALLYLGVVYAQLKEFETGLSYLLKAVEKPPLEDHMMVAESLANVAGMSVQNISEPQQMEQVLQAYDWVTTEVPDYQLESFHWNNLCWYGTLWGYSEEVLHKCEIAVEMEPDNGGYRDTRGLARTLSGDYEGAIEDFQAFIDWGPDNDVPDEAIARREEWIAALEAGENPFDEETLEMLRGE